MICLQPRDRDSQLTCVWGLQFFPVNSKSGFYGEPFTVHHDVTLLKNELAKTLLEKSPEWRTDNRVRLPADLETTVNYALIMCGQSTEVILAYQVGGYLQFVKLHFLSEVHRRIVHDCNANLFVFS